MKKEATAGDWSHQVKGSGTQIVIRGGQEPYLYVYAPNPGDEGDHKRFYVCEELAAFLNGGRRPEWLDELERTSPTQLLGADGTDIFAVGPWYDASPPRLDWRQRDDEASKAARARLIDRLCATP